MAITDWRDHNLQPFTAAFMFMDEATSTRLSRAKIRTADTPALAARMEKGAGDEFVFAHALVGPSDLLACVRCDDHRSRGSSRPLRILIQGRPPN